MAKLLGVGRQLMLIFVGCVRQYPAYFVESQYQIGLNGRFLHARRQKYITKPPKCQGNAKVLMV
jgi:hypothetical protein